MTQKQIFGAIALLAFAALVFVLVYRQMVPLSDVSKQAQKTTVSTEKQGTDTAAKTEAPIPSNIDDIARDIQGEVSVDTSALDDEESGELQGIEEDSQSVNNLEDAYDEDQL